MSIPGYWMYETGGLLRAAVEKYLAGAELDDAELELWRAYLRQWMKGPWHGGGNLAARVEAIATTADLRAWLADAMNAGIDPL